MSEEALIFDLTEKTFAEAALLNSHKLPVVVEFLASWSGPCFALADRFVALAREFPGRFVFARVDVEEQAGLLKEHGIENLPTTIVFQDGKAVRREEGEMNDDETRALLRDFGIFRESDALREKAREAHLKGDTMEAVMLLTQAAKGDPANPRVAMDMVQVLIDVRQHEEARALYKRLPDAVRDSATGRGLGGQLAFLELAANTDGIETLNRRLADNPDDHAARYDLAVCEVDQRRYPAAMDLLLHIHEHEPDFREGAAREMLITVINMLMPVNPELASEYRRRLGSLMS